jgi:rSAM/selenodomain-associated transferase 1
MELAQLAVFVRPPVAGSVKTRLANALGPSDSLRLYEAFVEDTISLCERVRAAGRVDVALWSAGPEVESVSAWAERLGTSVKAQPTGDLGVKLGAAFDEGLRRFERVVVIGSDLPTLPIELVVAAFDALQDASMSIGPANDGGYYAIGAARGRRPRFAGVRWSTEDACRDTLRANQGCRISILPPWYDVDELDDFEVLRAHLSTDPAAAPETARLLAELDARQR